MFNKIRQGKKIVKDIKNMVSLLKLINTHYEKECTLRREDYKNYAKEVNLYSNK